MSKQAINIILHPSKGVFKDKRSEFYAFAYPVESEDEIIKIRKELRKKYYDARHHVYAFRVGYEQFIEKMSDDGEPKNSSAPAVMGQIKSYNLTNILIVVVRYFGGKKLGIPGLIHAYKTAAKTALDNARITKKIIEKTASLEFPYDELNRVMNIVKQYTLHIVKFETTDRCRMQINIPENSFDDTIKKLNLLNISIILHKK